MRTSRVPLVVLSLFVAHSAWAQEDAVPPAVDEPAGVTTIPDEAPPPGVDEVPAEATQPVPAGAMIDGKVREGAFLSGPGSMTFVLHHTIMGATAGLITQGVGERFDLSLGSRERMLAGTLIGAGLGFGVSAWWQFNNWIGAPMATYAIVNSIASGLFFLGAMDLFVDNPLVLSWAAFVGAEVGAWLTTTLGGGDMPVNHGLLMASGGLWGLVYSSLFVALLGSTGNNMSPERVFDTLAIATGAGVGALALATARYNPTSAQILRADAFGLGVGGAVFLVSWLVLGLRFDIPTPYVLAALSSAGAITAVSLLWEEAAERPEDKAVGGNAAYFYRSKELDRPYRNVWW